ncbi:vWA domain-containing protein [Thiofilum flexile]|uniref:vWA domain-containing protein n=1 Tax=Thiofilum flexile TaxID=125627 RepID=UPI000381F2D0|nr:VWA domain-containing protein [Thiofilum flexile]
MYEFLWWWAFALLPLPILVYWLSPKASADNTLALKVPNVDEFELGEWVEQSTWQSRLKLLLASIIWGALVVAVARPVWIGEPVALPFSGRDLMLAVDLSGSMRETDFELNGRMVDRLTATQYVAGDFIRKRQGDRLGLIVFADQAYLQVPLTFDAATVSRLMRESFIGLAGERTAIGDAIGLALKRLKDNPEKNRVLILMTDGANTAGSVDPKEAADMAAKAGLKIYTVGIGSDANMVNSAFGFSFNNPSADLDEGLLKLIASKTSGQYFRARDTTEFSRIYSELDRLEPIEQEGKQWRPQHELFTWPLALAVVLGVGLLVWRRVE